MTYEEFKREHRTSIFSRGAYMEFMHACNFDSLSDIDNHLMWMKDLGLISRTEYLDLYRTAKAVKGRE